MFLRSSLVSFLLLLVILISTTSVLCKSNENFLQHLEGCHKGQNVKGVHKVKQYLKKFGYLHYSDHSTHANDDEFDDLVESAIKTYQLNHHLKQTGTLNSETLNMMTKPRCGFPDIINEHTTKKFKHGPLSLHTVSHYSFFMGPSGRPRRWSKTDLTYRFNSTVEVIDLPTLRPVISRAFAKWAAVTRFTFTEAQGGSNSDIEIGFHRLNHGDDSPFDGEGDQFGNTLAHAYAPEIGLFHYDADESWSTNPSATQFDLETIAVHEIGHLLGLRHSNDMNAIMWESIDAGEIKTELGTDDIQDLIPIAEHSPMMARITEAPPDAITVNSHALPTGPTQVEGSLNTTDSILELGQVQRRTHNTQALLNSSMVNLQAPQVAATHVEGSLNTTGERNPETEQEIGRIDLYYETQLSEKRGRWVGPVAHYNYDNIVICHFQASLEDSHPPTEDEKCNNVLGQRPGYTPSLGHSVMQTSSHQDCPSMKEIQSNN